jgi:hypothetical protein
MLVRALLVGLLVDIAGPCRAPVAKCRGSRMLQPHTDHDAGAMPSLPRDGADILRWMNETRLTIVGASGVAQP